MRTLRLPVGGRSPTLESHINSCGFMEIQRENATFEIATVCLRKPTGKRSVRIRKAAEPPTATSSQ